MRLLSRRDDCFEIALRAVLSAIDSGHGGKKCWVNDELDDLYLCNF